MKQTGEVRYERTCIRTQRGKQQIGKFESVLVAQSCLTL